MNWLRIGAIKEKGCLYISSRRAIEANDRSIDRSIARVKRWCNSIGRSIDLKMVQFDRCIYIDRSIVDRAFKRYAVIAAKRNQNASERIRTHYTHGIVLTIRDRFLCGY
jgi:alpha-N-acetylglucosamine transferase